MDSAKSLDPDPDVKPNSQDLQRGTGTAVLLQSARSQILERTMRFLGIILGVLRLCFFIQCLHYKTVSNHFSGGWAGVNFDNRGDCEKQGGKLFCPNDYVQEFGLWSLDTNRSLCEQRYCLLPENVVMAPLWPNRPVRIVPCADH
jgi:hypothetical protein